MNKNPYYYLGENPTVDLIVVNPLQEILMIRRRADSAACPGMLAFPGGFIDSDALAGSYWKAGKETPEVAAIRELSEETNLKLNQETELTLVGVYVGNNRDPRDSELSWSKSYAFYYRIDLETFNQQKKNIKGLDDAEAAYWIPVVDLKNLSLAFDHNIILENALRYL